MANHFMGQSFHKLSKSGFYLPQSLVRVFKNLSYDDFHVVGGAGEETAFICKKDTPPRHTRGRKDLMSIPFSVKEQKDSLVLKLTKAFCAYAHFEDGQKLVLSGNKDFIWIQTQQACAEYEKEMYRKLAEAMKPFGEFASPIVLINKKRKPK